MALITYGNGAKVIVPMQATRGFDKAAMKAAVPNALPGGWTPMGEGLYRGWDEVRWVANGTQSGLRVIVLFTDGSANGVPGDWDGTGHRQERLDIGLPAAITRSGQHHDQQPGHPGSVRRADRCPEPDADDVRRHLHGHERRQGRNRLSPLRRIDGHELAAGGEPSHASPQQRHPDVVSVPDQRAQRGRRVAVVAARPDGLQRRQRPLPGPRAEHQERGDQPGRDHRECGAQRCDRRLSDPHLHDRHGPARAASAGQQAPKAPKACSCASPTTSGRPTTTARRWKGSTTSPRPKRTWVRRSRRCRVRLFA